MSLMANHHVMSREVTSPPIEQYEAATELSGTSVTLAYDNVPSNGHLLMFIYRTTSGAPSTLPGGLTLLTSVDNNGLGIYIYTKVASSETNSYQFGDASTNEKSVIGVEISNYLSGASVLYTIDSGAGNGAAVNMPTVGTHLYPAGTLIIAPVVLLANRSISRTPFDFALGAPTNGTVGTFRTYAAFRGLSSNSNHQIQMDWITGTRFRALTIVVT